MIGDVEVSAAPKATCSTEVRVVDDVECSCYLSVQVTIACVPKDTVEIDDENC